MYPDQDAATRYRTTTDEDRQRINLERTEATWRRDGSITVSIDADDSPIAPQPSANDRLRMAIRTAVDAAEEMGLTDLATDLRRIWLN